MMRMDTFCIHAAALVKPAGKQGFRREAESAGQDVPSPPLEIVAAQVPPDRSIHINKFIRAQQHMREVAPRGFGVRFAGLREQVMADGEFFRARRTGEQQLAGPIDSRRLVGRGLAQEAFRQGGRLGLHEVVIEQQERLRGHGREGAFLHGGVGIGGIEERREVAAVPARGLDVERTSERPDVRASGPAGASSSRPETKIIASRMASASIRRAVKRPSQRLSGSRTACTRGTALVR